MLLKKRKTRKEKMRRKERKGKRNGKERGSSRVEGEGSWIKGE